MAVWNGVDDGVLRMATALLLLPRRRRAEAAAVVSQAHQLQNALVRELEQGAVVAATADVQKEQQTRRLLHMGCLRNLPLQKSNRHAKPPARRVSQFPLANPEL